ncbi:DUF3043 domain-containing protein [Kitasatospora griseola]|uniref:DUF3043 domain-containing protein n=1 Tax=Kitasatospora griseola TaxID=2064 RepID=UPI00382A8D29
MFRRRSEDSAASSTVTMTKEDERLPRDPQAPKGRPTPKRSEAEANRKTRVTVPKDRKEAARQARDRMRVEREKQRIAMLEGDERALPARDKGPVKRYTRDFIDSRRAVAEYFLPFAVVVLVLGIVRIGYLQTLSSLLFMLFFVTVILDFVRISLALRKGLAARFPNENARGAVMYGLLRTLQMRRLRMPKPMVKRGERP